MKDFILYINNYLKNIKNEHQEEIKEFLRWTKAKIDINFKKTSKRFLKKGDIYEIRLCKNIGSEYNKTRPCIIFRNNKFVNSKIITIIPLSTKTKEKNIVYIDLIINSDNTNNLKSDSIIKTAHIKSISINRITKKIGKININTIVSIENKLLLLFDIKQKNKPSK